VSASIYLKNPKEKPKHTLNNTERIIIMPKECASLDQYHKGCYLQGHYLYNSSDQRIMPLHCNRYSCSLHGWKKKARLQKAIEIELRKFKNIRFWTFTLSSASFDSPEEHYRVLAKAWRKFLTECRRNSILTNFEQKFQYVKVIDSHKSGFLHFHGFFDRYISIYKIYAIWTAAVHWASKSTAVGSSCWVKSLGSAKIASNYVAKYVTKSAAEILFRLNYYSKSQHIVLFPKMNSNQNWLHATDFFHLAFLVESSSPLLVPPVQIVTHHKGKLYLFERSQTAKTQKHGLYGSGI
jgi:hypothetical protein